MLNLAEVKKSDLLLYCSKQLNWLVIYFSHNPIVITELQVFFQDSFALVWRSVCWDQGTYAHPEALCHIKRSAIKKKFVSSEPAT